MGERGVALLVDSIEGRDVAKRVDTGCVVVTRENMETPEARGCSRSADRRVPQMTGWSMPRPRPRMRTDLPDALPSHSAPLLAMRGVCKRYGGVKALRGVDLCGRAGRGPRAGRRERRGQEHAHEGPLRRRASGRRNHGIRGPRLETSRTGSGTSRRRRDDPSGTGARTASFDRREHRARGRAERSSGAWDRWRPSTAASCMRPLRGCSRDSDMAVWTRLAEPEIFRRPPGS